ncbi:MAG: hydroxypyruvate reductase [Betaproteobacteria bacterium RIFCSPLOWO2_12_FULL_65_14]|nr:MAG: hydroxypyruvate reductase [Betaproteobacteria bacterium RIFCSPLOWO2_12_FULL_65_14]
MRALLEESFRAAVAAADPLQILAPHLPPAPKGRTLVAAAGKAAASMALAVEQHFRGELDGIAIVRYGHGLPTKKIRVVEAGHPVPDEAGEAAAREIFARTSALKQDDLLLALLSGGGSSLLSLPAPGIPMADLKAVTQQLLKSGAPIQEMNTVRKHLSAIHGGRLAAASRARVLALIISDVTGDDPTHIASGPCAPDPTTYADALEILRRYAVAPPPSVKARLEKGADETPKPGDPVFARVTNKVIATAHRSLEAAAEVFRKNHITPVILGDTITGEASEVAKVFASLVREIRQHGAPWKPPVALVSGGECTVTLRGEGGRGGRCSEFLLSLGVETGGLWALAADTDGIDGSENNAGAILTPDSMRRGRDARGYLGKNDSYSFFSALGDLLVTGPTRTNVNDYRAILVL